VPAHNLSKIHPIWSKKKKTNKNLWY